MRKHYLSLLSFSILLCMMLLGVVSCKKNDGGDTPNTTGSDFFIEVDFLPKAETNGATAPRLIANFNNEAMMVELRPSAGSEMETVLFLSPDNEAMMMCGNDSLMICVPYDLETYTPSDDVLLVTPADDALLLTKCVMDWRTNTMTKGDMMVLPIEDNSKHHGKKGGSEEDMRVYFYNHLVKPLIENFEQAENHCSFLGIHTGIVLSYVKTIIATTMPVFLFSDDPELLTESMESPVTKWTSQAIQHGVLYSFSRDLREMKSILYSGLSWFVHGGQGKINDYSGENGGINEFSYPSLWSQSGNVIRASDILNVQPPAYNVNLSISNVTENSAYLKGRFQFTSSITPVEMGYVFKLSGGPENIVEDMNFQGKTISGLQKATKYTAYAYAKNLTGDRVVSPEVTFWTLGFEAFPNSLTFPAEGDTKYVALSYSEEDITSWDITSKPSWCNTTIDDLGLLAVTVDASTETRSGNITIKAHSNALGNVTENIEVTQIGTQGWDGTAWVFSGTITTHDYEGHTTSQEMTLTLMVNSVSNKDITFSWAQALSAAANNGYSDNYVLNGNGNLVYSATAGYSGEWGSNNITSQVTFVQTGPTTATANLQYRESFSNYFITMSGLLQGTLIRADEIGNYETIFNLKIPVLIIKH